LGLFDIRFLIKNSINSSLINTKKVIGCLMI